MFENWIYNDLQLHIVTFLFIFCCTPFLSHINIHTYYHKDKYSKYEEKTHFVFVGWLVVVFFFVYDDFAIVIYALSFLLLAPSICLYMIVSLVYVCMARNVCYNF